MGDITIDVRRDAKKKLFVCGYTHALRTLASAQAKRTENAPGSSRLISGMLRLCRKLSDALGVTRAANPGVARATDKLVLADVPEVNTANLVIFLYRTLSSGIVCSTSRAAGKSSQ